MKTEWNYEPCIAIRTIVVVGDAPEFPSYWAREFIGQTRFAVRVTYNGQTFFIDDEDGSGWFKVTNGGGPEYNHRNLGVKSVIENLEKSW
jgi:hypothetical protein